MKIPFCLPLIDKDVNQEVLSCLNETGWLTTGPKVKLLEDEITKLCQTSSTICVNSWTSGMLLLIRWLDLDEDDEIIVPTYTYAASAFSVINSRVKCVFVDVNSDFTININEVEKAMTEKTKAIMPVDLGGLPADYIALNNLLSKKSIKSRFNPKTDFQRKIGRPIVISDAAHSIGSLIDGVPTPLFSDFSVFSFHSVKNITTGEGGAITFKIFNKAAIGLAQIKKYKSVLLPEREQIFLKYNSVLSKYSWAILPTFSVNNRKSSCHLYKLRIEGFEEHQRDELINRLTFMHIGVNVHYIPLPMLSYFKSIGLDIKDFPSSYNLFKNEITLPIYNDLSIKSVEYIAEKLIEIVNEIIK